MTVFSINSNIASLMAQRRTSEASEGLRQTYQRLASGLRINRASDDAAGLAVASQLAAHGRIFGQAIRNINDAASLLNVAEGAVGELSTILERLKELATQAASGSLGRTQRLSLDAEAYELQKEFNRITAATSFNGRSLTAGNFGKLNIQAGFGSGGLLSFNLGASLEYNAGTGVFGGPNQVGSWYQDITQAPLSTVGDFNNDGLDDIFLSAEGGGQSVLLLNLGNGEFDEVSVGEDLSGDSDTRIGDVNNDGNLDIVSPSFVILGNGDGTFKNSISLFQTAYQIRLADVDNDGNLDYIGHKAGATVTVMLGNGDGTFRHASDFAGGASDMEVGDCNGDGKGDVVGKVGNKAQLFIGAGNGTFSIGQAFVAGNTTDLLDVGDTNNDGIDDLLIAGGGFSGILLGSASSTFTYSGPFQHHLGMGRFADINRDGVLDVIGSDFNSFLTYLGNGDGSFGSALVSLYYGIGTGQEAMNVGDFDGDGALDILYNEDPLGELSIQYAATVKQTIFQRLNLSTKAGALSALETIDEGLARIWGELGDIGANQRRLNSTLATIQATETNYKAAHGRIMDMDAAQDTAALAAQQIRQQAATAVLSQANQLPSLALSLLRV